MLTLITFPPGFGSPSLSPFCAKAIYLLNLSGLEWQPEVTSDPRRMPHGKLPVLRTPEALIPDSDGIGRYLEQQGATFSAGLSDEEAGTARALIRMMEDHLYPLLLLDRWERDDVWPLVRDTCFAEIPVLLRGAITAGIRRNLLRGMETQGLARLTWEERLVRADQDLAVLRQRLETRPFLFGDVPTLADASGAAILGALRATPVDTPLSRRVSDDAELSGYVDRADTVMAGQHPATGALRRSA